MLHCAIMWNEHRVNLSVHEQLKCCVKSYFFQLGLGNTKPKFSSSDETEIINSLECLARRPVIFLSCLKPNVSCFRQSSTVGAQFCTVFISQASNLGAFLNRLYNQSTTDTIHTHKIPFWPQKSCCQRCMQHSPSTPQACDLECNAAGGLKSHSRVQHRALAL